MQQRCKLVNWTGEKIRRISFSLLLDFKHTRILHSISIKIFSPSGWSNTNNCVSSIIFEISNNYDWRADGKHTFIIEETDAACSTNNRSVLIADHRYTESSPFWLQYLFLLHSAGRFFDASSQRLDTTMVSYIMFLAPVTPTLSILYQYYFQLYVYFYYLIMLEIILNFFFLGEILNLKIKLYNWANIIVCKELYMFTFVDINNFVKFIFLSLII